MADLGGSGGSGANLGGSGGSGADLGGSGADLDGSESKWCWDALKIKIPGIDLGSSHDLGSQLAETRRKGQLKTSDGLGEQSPCDDDDDVSTLTMWEEDGIKIWSEDEDQDDDWSEDENQDGVEEDQDGVKDKQLTCISQRRATTPIEENNWGCGFCGKFNCLCDFSDRKELYDWA